MKWIVSTDYDGVRSALLSLSLYLSLALALALLLSFFFDFIDFTRPNSNNKYHIWNPAKRLDTASTHWQLGNDNTQYTLHFFHIIENIFCNQNFCLHYSASKPNGPIVITNSRHQYLEFPVIECAIISNTCCNRLWLKSNQFCWGGRVWRAKAKSVMKISRVQIKWFFLLLQMNILRMKQHQIHLKYGNKSEIIFVYMSFLSDTSNRAFRLKPNKYQ